MMLDPAIGTLIIASVAFLFASAAVHKFRDLGRFGESLSAYELAPQVAELGLHPLVPVLEIATAAGLVSRPTRGAAAVLAIALLSIYAGAIAINLKRGRRDLACGCGGPNDRRPIAPWMIWRNGLIALATAVAFIPWSARPLGLTDAVTVAFAVLTITLMYLSVDQLFGNAARNPFGVAR